MSTSNPEISDIHRQWVEAAVLAPSPDNNQPWRFVSRGDRLDVYLDPTRALPSDVNRMFDLMGIGAAIENARIAARQAGFELDIQYFPIGPAQDQSPPQVASAALVPGGESDPLHEHLEGRLTNRKLYSTRPVDETQLGRLARAAGEFSEVRLDWITDRRTIRAFAWLIAASDRFRFGYEPFHQEIFRQLRFTADEAERTRDGLDLRTLELPPGAALALRWLRPWPRMRRLQRLGLARLLTLPSALSVWKSGTLGVLSLPEPATDRFLTGGRAFQRIWLTAEAEGLALQPLGSLPIFVGQLEQLEGRNLTPSHRNLAGRLRQRFDRLVPTSAGRTLLMLFRLGHAARPHVRALRRFAGETLASGEAAS